MENWQKYTGDYQPLFYDLKLKSGTVVMHCWPFAHHFTPVNSSGDNYIEDWRVAEVRVCEKQWEEYIVPRKFKQS